MPDRELTDQEIAEGLECGDHELFTRIYHQYNETVRRKVLYSLIYRDEETAESITQEVFFRLWRSRTRYDWRKGTFAGYLLAIATTATMEAIAKQSFVRTLGHEYDFEQVPVTDADEDDELLKRFRLCFAALSAIERKVLRLWSLGWESKETASKTGQTAENVRVIKHRAIPKLWRCLDQDHDPTK